MLVGEIRAFEFVPISGHFQGLISQHWRCDLEQTTTDSSRKTIELHVDGHYTPVGCGLGRQRCHLRENKAMEVERRSISTSNQCHLWGLLSN